MIFIWLLLAAFCMFFGISQTAFRAKPITHEFISLSYWSQSLKSFSSALEMLKMISLHWKKWEHVLFVLKCHHCLLSISISFYLILNNTFFFFQIFITFFVVSNEITVVTRNTKRIIFILMRLVLKVIQNKEWFQLNALALTSVI